MTHLVSSDLTTRHNNNAEITPWHHSSHLFRGRDRNVFTRSAVNVMYARMSDNNTFLFIRYTEIISDPDPGHQRAAEDPDETDGDILRDTEHWPGHCWSPTLWQWQCMQVRRSGRCKHCHIPGYRKTNPQTDSQIRASSDSLWAPPSQSLSQEQSSQTPKLGYIQKFILQPRTPDSDCSMNNNTKRFETERFNLKIKSKAVHVACDQY